MEFSLNEDLGSEFEFDSENAARRKRRHDLAEKDAKPKIKLPKKEDVTTEFNKEEGKVHRLHLISLDAYARHKKFINDYLMYYGGSTSVFQRDSSHDKRDIDVIREHHQFLWSDEDRPEESWEKRLAKKYFDKLFKEYCIADLSLYKENKIALRWRTEKEVISGKGQFSCGAKRCEESEGLRSWEVNFGYLEHGEKKNALVKLRLCPDCSYKLNYRHRRKEIIKNKSKTSLLPDSAQTVSNDQPIAENNGDAKTVENLETSQRVAAASSSNKSATEQKQVTEQDSGVIWSGPQKISEDKSRDDEFNEYFEDMFM